MEAVKVAAYYKAITQIEAQEVLVQMRVADYPHLKKQSRERFFNDIRRCAYPPTESDKNDYVSVETLVKNLIGIKHGGT